MGDILDVRGNFSPEKGTWLFIKSENVFYIDVDVGEYQITVLAMLYPGETTIDIKVNLSETLYVKTHMGGGAFIGRTNVEVMKLIRAKNEIDEM